MQTEIGLAALPLDLEPLTRSETFAAGEVRLQAAVESALASPARETLPGRSGKGIAYRGGRAATACLLELAEGRRRGFWSTHHPEIKTRWEVIAGAGRVLIEAARVESALKGKSWTAMALSSRYVYGDEPWCALDMAQRHLERDFHRFELDHRQHESLIKLAALARRRYAEVANDLAERFTRGYAAESFELPGVLLQADIYADVVVAAAKRERVAYIQVDALRFEMARELGTILSAVEAKGRVLDPGWSYDLTPALATAPTVTEIGMAALLPGAERGVAVAPTESGKPAAAVAGTPLRTRQERLDHFKAALDGKAVVARLDQLAPLSDVHLAEALKPAGMALITSTEEIDGLCENNPALARRMLDDVLNQLRRAIKTLFGLGFQMVIITADHGYLFGERLTTGEGIDPPGGKTALLKRRVWVGQGGAGSGSFLRAPLASFGIGGQFELATPWNLAVFKVPGGATEYFHGGLSLQELVIPVLAVRSAAAQRPGEVARIRWSLTLGSKTISTRFLSVTVEGRSEELLPLEPPLVRVEVRAGDQPISTPVSATYGYQEATRDIQLVADEASPQVIVKNTITLMITTETPPVDQVTVHLLDATTGVSLERVQNVPFAITL